jgi:hypothetical protein
MNPQSIRELRTGLAVLYSIGAPPVRDLALLYGRDHEDIAPGAWTGRPPNARSARPWSTAISRVRALLGRGDRNPLAKVSR